MDKSLSDEEYVLGSDSESDTSVEFAKETGNRARVTLTLQSLNSISHILKLVP